MPIVPCCEPLAQIAYTEGVSRKNPVPADSKPAAPAPAPRLGHPLVHLLLAVLCCTVSVSRFFPFPSNQIGFPHFVLLLGYLYPLLLKWLRPRTGFWMGLILLLLILGAAETVGLFFYEIQTTGLVFPHGFTNDVLLAPVVLLSFILVGLSGITFYLAGWSMLTIWRKIFAKQSAPEPQAKTNPKPKPTLKAKTKAQPTGELEPGSSE
jgi:hypothetical protein